MSFSDRAGTDTATPGRFSPLWSETMPALDDLGHDARSVDLDDLDADLAVVDEDPVTDRDVSGQVRRRSSSRP